MRVMIAGGSGFIGRGLTQALLLGGHQVVILSRSPGSRKVPEGVEYAVWDGRTADGWGPLVEEVDAVVNLVGENIGAGRWTAARKQRILDSRRQSGEAITEAIRRASKRPEVVLQASGIGHYGFTGQREVDEQSPVGNDFLAQVTVAWEGATAGVEELGVRRVVTRNSLVLHASQGIFPLVLLPFRLFVGGPLGSGRQPFPWIHLDDQVQGILYLLQNRAAQGVYNFCAPEQVDNAQVGRAVAKVMHRPYWFPVPAFAMRLALGEMSTLVLEGQRALPRRLLEAGYAFRFPTFEGALRDLLKR